MKRLALLLLLFVAVKATGQTYIAPSIADAQLNYNQVCTDWQTSNYSTENHFTVAEWTWFSGFNCGQGTTRGVMRFDMNVGALHNELYDNRARLKLFFPDGFDVPPILQSHRYNGLATGNAFFINRITELWDEASVTFSTQPDYSSLDSIYVPTTVDNPSTQDYIIDVSAYANAWICSQQPNFGLLFKLEEEGTIYKQQIFTTREWSDPANRPLIELEYARIEALGPETACSGDTIDLSVLLQNAADPSLYTFSWEYLNTGALLNGDNQSVTLENIGIHTFVLKGSNSLCNSATDTLRIEVVGAGQISINSSDADLFLCPGDSTLLSIAPELINAIWSNGGIGNEILVNAPGTYSVTATLGNCTANALLTLTAAELPPLSATAQNNGIVCPGETVALTASGGFTSYIWSNGASGAEISVSNPGIFLVTAITAEGCELTSSEIPVSQAVIDTPAVILPDGNTFCAGDMLSALAEPNLSSIIWQDGTTGSNYSSSASAILSYSAIDALGCSVQSQPAVVTMNSQPVVDASASETLINLGDTIQLSANGALTYSWSPDNGLSCNDCPSPFASPNEPTTYIVAGTDENGCISYDSIEVDIRCNEPFIPTIFSPNGKGPASNELLCLFSNCVAQLKFVVFNRWGEQVFETEDVSKCWDGLYKGEEASSGLYAYNLYIQQLDGNVVNKKGMITLLK
jgi:gliding motility-associated-like protein